MKELDVSTHLTEFEELEHLEVSKQVENLQEGKQVEDLEDLQVEELEDLEESKHWRVLLFLKFFLGLWQDVLYIIGWGIDELKNWQEQFGNFEDGELQQDWQEQSNNFEEDKHSRVLLFLKFFSDLQ